MQSSTHEIIKSTLKKPKPKPSLLSLSSYNTHLSSMQQHHLTAASMSANTTSCDREIKKLGEYEDTSANNNDDSRRNGKKPSTCSEETSNESNGGGGGETGFQECNPTDNAAENKGVVTTTKTMTKAADVAVAEDTGRERLKRHRVEVAGRVWIPDIWGQEDLLKDWIDCCGFDASLMNSNVMSAREALMEEGRRATSSRLRIENSC